MHAIKVLFEIKRIGTFLPTLSLGISLPKFTTTFLFCLYSSHRKNSPHKDPVDLQVGVPWLKSILIKQFALTNCPGKINPGIRTYYRLVSFGELTGHTTSIVSILQSHKIIHRQNKNGRSKFEPTVSCISRRGPPLCSG